MNLIKTSKKCYKYLFDQKSKFWLLNFFKVIFLLISLVPAYITSIIIANLQLEDFSLLLIIIGVLAISYIVYLLFDCILFLLRQSVEKSARTNLKKVFMKKLFSHAEIKIDTAKITEILYTDVNNVINLQFIIFDEIMNIVFILGLGIFLFELNWILGFIILITSFFSSILTFFMRRKIKLRELNYRKETDYHFKLIRDIIKNIKLIKTSNSVDSHLENYEKNLDEVKEATISKEKLTWFIGFIGKFIDYFVLICILILGVKFISDSLLSVAGLLLFISYSKMFSTLCNNTLKSYVNIQQIMVSVERALPILDYHLIKKNRKFPEVLTSIKIENLSYNYEEKNVFSNFNLEIGKGQCVLLVGHNGSGKTTLLNLIAALSITNDGTIMFNDVPIDEIEYEDIQNEVTYYSQDDVLFDQSIRKNVLSFKHGDEVSDNELYQICSRLGILDEILKLDNGFDTLLSEYKTLSLGQRKKLLFARTFLKPSQVLLLDEPLTGLDQQSQTTLLEMINELKGRKIVIIATHKPELFEFYDKCIQL